MSEYRTRPSNLNENRIGIFLSDAHPDERFRFAQYLYTAPIPAVRAPLCTLEARSSTATRSEYSQHRREFCRTALA